MDDERMIEEKTSEIENMNDDEFESYIKDAKEENLGKSPVIEVEKKEEEPDKKDDEDINIPYFLSGYESYEKRVQKIQENWQREGDALKAIVPEFDIKKAFENPDFYNSVVKEHKSIFEAYQLLPKKTQRRGILEIGNLTNGVTGSVSHDVKSMSDKEFDEYIKRIKSR